MDRISKKNIYVYIKLNHFAVLLKHCKAAVIQFKKLKLKMLPFDQNVFLGLFHEQGIKILIRLSH